MGRFREVTTAAGDRLRVGVVALDASETERSVRRRLRYERIPATGPCEVVERDWTRRWWSQAQFGAMLLAAGFDRVRFLGPQGGRAPADATVFVALGRRG